MTETLTDEAQRTPSTHGAGANGTTTAWWRALVLRLHFYAGSFVGPFLLIAAVTGTLYALSPRLEPLLYADQLNARTNGPGQPLARQVESAQRVVPDSTLTAVRPAPHPGVTTRVLFDDETLGESESQTVFIDPATGASQGVLTTYGTSGALPVRTWLDQLHRSLLLGDPGRLYSELAASWLWVLVLGGAAMWLTHPARRRRARSILRPDSGLAGRARSRSLHATVGIWAGVGFLALSATGLTWSTYAGAHVNQLREQLHWMAPEVDAATPRGEHAGHHHVTDKASSTTTAAGTRDIDTVLATARAHGIDAAKVELAPPAAPGQAWTVTEIDRGWPTQVDAVAVDAQTRRMVDQVRFADYPLMAKLARWGIDAHMGTLFGLPNQLLLTGLGIALTTMLVLGYRMWWQRRPTRVTAFRVGRPYPRGALRRTPKPAVIAVTIGALVVGWFLPLLGLSLLAFLLVDLTLATANWLRS